jgi:succinyl-diaminopimelate desuccinylase
MKEKNFSWIDNSVELAIELETELTKRPAISPESGGEGELDKVIFLEGWLKSHGITQLERYDAPDGRAKGGVRPNLIATIDGRLKDGKRLWIMSHTDVVPPGEITLWKSDPWVLQRSDGPEGTMIIGRGVEDNQQGLVSSVLAALSFVKQGLKPERTIKLLFAADEENGSYYGIDWLIKNHGDLFRKNDMVLVPDGGDKNGDTIEIAEKNIVWARFVTKGKQCHGSNPALGANACLAGAELAVRLHDGLYAKFPARDPLFEPEYSTFEPTKKEANVPNINTIPGEDVFCMDMRFLPQYPIESVLAEIDRIKGEVAHKHGVTIEYSTPQVAQSKPTSDGAPVVKALKEAVSEVYNVKARSIGIGGGTVAAYLRNIGIDSAVWARLGDSAHQPNEYALISSITGDAKVMACLAGVESK